MERIRKMKLRDRITKEVTHTVTVRIGEGSKMVNGELVIDRIESVNGFPIDKILPLYLATDELSEELEAAAACVYSFYAVGK